MPRVHRRNAIVFAALVVSAVAAFAGEPAELAAGEVRLKNGLVLEGDAARIAGLTPRRSTLRSEVGADEASVFYEKCYRQAYLRFLVFLSAFYDVGRKKESYFWEAQRLTEQDVQTGDLKYAFLNLVTGIKDMSDMQSDAHRLVLETMGKRIDQNLNFRKDKLALALKELQAAGLVERTVRDEYPPAPLYLPTPTAQRLMPILRQL